MRKPRRKEESNLVFYAQSTSTVCQGEWVEVSNLVFYARSTSTVISERMGGRKEVTWCFTPSQPVQLYQGESRSKLRRAMKKTKTRT